MSSVVCFVKVTTIMMNVRILNYDTAQRKLDTHMYKEAEDCWVKITSCIQYLNRLPTTEKLLVCSISHALLFGRVQRIDLV